MSSQSKVTVLLADDHVLVRDGLKRLINEQLTMEVVAEAGDGDEAIRLTRSLKPNVAVIDVSMPGRDGLNVAAALQDLVEVRVLALTRHDHHGFVERMMRAGAAGYVLKQSPSHVLVSAIESVARGETFLDPALSPAAINSPAPPPLPLESLTVDEDEVLRLVALGHSQTEIAERLQLPREMVVSLRADGMRKASLGGRVDVIRYAIDRGWLRSA